MVVANNKIIFLLIYFFMIYPIITQAAAQKEEAILYVKTKVAKATKELGDVIILCEKKSVGTITPVLNNKYLKSINTNKTQLITGLGHLNFRNKLKCERNSRVNLAYELATLNLVYEYYQLDTQSVKEIASGLIYPTMSEIQLSVSYMKLPDKLKQYLENVIGVNQFDLFEMLENNQLSSEK